METEQVKHLLAKGQTPRQIADSLGCKRLDVEAIANELASTKHKSRIRLMIFLSMALLALAGASVLVYKTFRQPTILEVYTQIVKAADGLSTNKAGYSWFIEQESTLKKDEDINAEINLIQQLNERVNKTLADNSDIPKVKEERDEFGGHIMPSIFTTFSGGTSRFLTRSATPPNDSKMIEITFYGHYALNHRHVAHRLLFYDAGWRSLFIAALKFTDDKWYDSILAHELWHALMHRRGNPSATAPQLSDLWVTEELDAHDLEADVLNARTRGAYRQRLEAIASRISARSTAAFLLQVQPEDLRQLDQLFNPGIPEEMDIRSAGYELNLAETWLGKNYTGDDLRKKKIEAYKFLIDPRQSTNVQ